MEKHDKERTYRDSIEKLFHIALNRHHFYFIDMPNYQYSIVKTYLWIAAFIISAQIAIIHNFKIEGLVKLFSFASVIFSAFAFGIAVYTMKLKKAVQSSIENLLEIDQLAWDYSLEDDTSFMRSIINGINSDLNHLITTTNSRGLKLRAIAWLLLIAFIFEILTIFSVI